ncbi:MAG TPA: ferrous iron transport protein A [Clostridiales bacterium]|nr:ferrous iron transport protein A [Clostridiales bacterium]
MTLVEGKLGEIYTVSSLSLEQAVMRRLEALGLTRGTDIKILNRNREGSVVVMVRGSRLALGRKIAETIRIGEGNAPIKGTNSPTKGMNSSAKKDSSPVRRIK